VGLQGYSEADMTKKDRSRWQLCSKLLKMIVLGISALFLILPAYAQEAPKEQGKGLDEQVQEIKTDVLSIAAQLNQLEEKLLYPSDTQVALFVSLAKGKSSALMPSISNWTANRSPITFIRSKS